jgi:hypothetical protein
MCFVVESAVLCVYVCGCEGGWVEGALVDRAAA